MLRIGVELPPALTTAGEFLADVQAYEAAGVDSIWLSSPPERDAPGFEPLTLLAATAVVTARARLGAMMRVGSPWPAALLTNVVTTLAELSRGRVLVGIETDHRAPTDEPADELAGALRAAGASVFLRDDGRSERIPSLGAGMAGGIVSTGTAADELAARFAESELELWVRVEAPGGRAAWREMLTAHETAGATGMIVAHAPNLLDILRNPEEDDRQDLAMAVG
jgi:hypothetical protein